MLIVKVGGGDLDLDAVAADVASLGRPLVLLHGANRLRDELATALGKPPEVVESVSGYTSVLTDDDAIDVMLAAYAGIRNKRLVEALRKAGVDALGLTGLDGGLVRGEKNRGIRVVRDGRKLLLRDQSGKPRAVDGGLLRTLLDRGHIPVLTVPIASEDGEAMNTENDDVLALLAAELGATDVVSLIEAPGLLVDRHDEGSVVPTVDPSELEGWEERVEGRMRRKIRALRTLFELCPAPGPRVRLADGRTSGAISTALAGGGTLIARRPDAGGRPDDPRAGAPTAHGGGDHADPSPDGSSEQWLQRQAVHELDVYGKRGIALVSGAGARVVDADGREYVDCIGGHGSLALGHRHPAQVAALTAQAGRIWFVPGAFGSPPRAAFLDRLHASLPPELSHTFLSNSGTEAIEAALKIARAHTGRATFVAAQRGFHGRTMGALSVTADPHYRDAFEPLVSPVRRVRYDDADALRAAVDGDVAAVVLEVVQGESPPAPVPQATRGKLPLMARLRTRLALIVAGCALTVSTLPAQQATTAAERRQAWADHVSMRDTSAFAGMRWHALGPSLQSSRIEAIALEPGNPSTMYVGPGAGNVWKTTNNGITWTPVFEQESAFAVGDIAVAPSDAQVVWVGTGEVQPRHSGPAFAGTGVFKSIDAGGSWVHMGLDDTHHIGKVLIHPANPV